jgi:hypothetical protein
MPGLARVAAVASLVLALAIPAVGELSGEVSADFQGGTYRTSRGIPIGPSRIKVRVSNGTDRPTGAVTVRLYFSFIGVMYGDPPDKSWVYKRVPLRPPLKPGETRTVVVRARKAAPHATVEFVKAEFPLAIEVDGKILRSSHPPVSQGGATLVPLADVARALGAEVEWDAATRRVTIHRKSTTVSLRVGDKSATVDGKPLKLQVPASVRDGATMVPLRFVCQGLGAEVGFDADRNVVSVAP